MSLMIKISIIFSIFIILLSKFLAKSQFGWDKISQYECGLETFEEHIGIDGREKFYIKFFIIGIIFLIFDIESILLFPIPILINNNFGFNLIGFFTFIFFLFMLILGLIYEYSKKVFF